MKPTQTTIVKAVAYLLGAIATALCIAFGMSSCSAVRTVTTSSEFYHKGDTSVVIQTKTVEKYQAEKKSL